MEQTVCGSELPTTGGIQVVVDEYLSGRVRQKQEVKLTLKAVIASVRGRWGGVLWLSRASLPVLLPSCCKMLVDSLPASGPSLSTVLENQDGSIYLVEPPRWKRRQKERPIFIHYHIQKLDWEPQIGVSNEHPSGPASWAPAADLSSCHVLPPALGFASRWVIF